MMEKIDLKELPTFYQAIAEQGAIPTRLLERAVMEQKRTGESLAQILIRQELASPRVVAQALARQYGLPYEDIKPDNIEPPRGFPDITLFFAYGMAPIRKEEGRLVVAISDPANLEELDRFRALYRTPIMPVIADQEAIADIISRLKAVSAEDLEVLAREMIEKGVTSGSVVEDVPAVRFVQSVILYALSRNASDIHLEPTETVLRVRIRVDGILHDIISLPKEAHQPLLSRIKVISGMDITEKRLPQDGKLYHSTVSSHVDIRISTYPSIHGESCVMRLLCARKELMSLAALGYSAADEQKIRQLLKKSYGIILFCGPTGSGKTTTLYACLKELDATVLNIMTIEDPIEYAMPGVKQAQINPEAGFTFASALRSMMRHDPDVILVGEIRDQETAALAFQAAQTGHLVLSTVHTNTAVEAVVRLLALNTERHILASGLLGCVGQRLVRRLCPHCRIKLSSPGEIEGYLARQGIDSQYHGVLQNGFYVHGKGCEWCFGGYQDRITISEVFLLTDRIRQMIIDGNTGPALKETAIEEGMTGMVEDGMNKSVAGLTDPMEVLRVVF